MSSPEESSWVSERVFSRSVLPLSSLVTQRTSLILQSWSPQNPEVAASWALNAAITPTLPEPVPHHASPTADTAHPLSVPLAVSLGVQAQTSPALYWRTEPRSSQPVKPKPSLPHETSPALPCTNPLFPTRLGQERFQRSRGCLFVTLQGCRSENAASAALDMVRK